MKTSFQQNIIIVIIIAIATIAIAGAVYYFYLPGGIKDAFNLRFEPQRSQCSNPPKLKDNAKRRVVDVIDGDTFKIKGGYSVRIIGIDTDERGNRCYVKAKNKLRELILDEKVMLQNGPEEYDKYCRYLRHIFVNGKNVALMLVKEGLAESYNLQDHQYSSKIREAEREAKKENKGCEWNDYSKNNGRNWSKITPNKTGLKIIKPCSAEKYLGEKVVIEGKVIDTYYHKESGTTFLNFGKPYPNNCFVAVVLNSDLDNFSKNPADFYYKRVRIKGEIKEYQNKPEIILENPKQIEVGE